MRFYALARTEMVLAGCPIPPDWVMNHHIYFHIVWTTRNRRRLISREVAEFLDRVLRAIATQERSLVLALGMVMTHVQVLVRAHPMTTVPRLLQRLKGASSALAGRELQLPPDRELYWAQSYTIHSVSPSAVEKVRDYVRNQATRHPNEAIKGWRGNVGDPRDAGAPGGFVRKWGAWSG